MRASQQIRASKERTFATASGSVQVVKMKKDVLESVLFRLAHFLTQMFDAKTEAATLGSTLVLDSIRNATMHAMIAIRSWLSNAQTSRRVFTVARYGLMLVIKFTFLVLAL